MSSGTDEELRGTWVGCSIETAILSADGISPSLALLVTDAKTDFFDGPNASSRIIRGFKGKYL